LSKHDPQRFAARRETNSLAYLGLRIVKLTLQQQIDISKQTVGFDIIRSEFDRAIEKNCGRRWPLSAAMK
jgi:hypothetical protein